MPAVLSTVLSVYFRDSFLQPVSEFVYFISRRRLQPFVGLISSWMQRYNFLQQFFLLRYASYDYTF